MPEMAQTDRFALISVNSAVCNPICFLINFDRYKQPMDPLLNTFSALLEHHAVPDVKIAELWQEICTCYAEPHRHYHTIHHLEQVFRELSEIDELLINREAVLLALFYHDLVYDVKRHDNEAASAALASKRLTAIGFAGDTIKQCTGLILATKDHAFYVDSDVNYFTDADLAILGTEPAQYDTYVAQIRRQYKIYPDTLYRAGRKRVLHHFLEKANIFNTSYFRNRLEQQARTNMQRELTQL